MTKEFDKKAIDRLTKIKITSSLSDKELFKTFNLSSYRWTKLKKEIKEVKTTDKDWIYGALRSSGGLKTTDDIINYIDFKNKARLTEKTVLRGLESLVNEGHAYKHKEKWNYTQRLIEVYSNKTDKFVTEVELGHFDLKRFKKIYKPKTWDYLMYECFDITPGQEKLYDGLVLIDFDFDKYSYKLTCRQGEVV
jgi:hypothetical protein